MTPHNPSEIMIELARHLARDQELQNWCRRELGAGLQIRLGVDEDNPPGPEDYPIAGITDVVEQRGDGRGVQIFTVELACGLVNEQVAADPELANLTVYAGLPQVADLKHRLEAACFRLPGMAVAVRGESVPLSLYPLFVGYTTVELSFPITRRTALR